MLGGLLRIAKGGLICQLQLIYLDQRSGNAQVVVGVFKVKLSILTRVLQRQLNEITRVLIQGSYIDL